MLGRGALSLLNGSAAVSDWPNRYLKLVVMDPLLACFEGSKDPFELLSAAKMISQRVASDAHLALRHAVA